MIKAALLLVAFVLDIFVGSIFGVAFVQTGLSITPNIFFITLILVTYREPNFEAFIIALIAGLIMDSFNRDVLFLNTAIYLFSVLIVRAWSTRVNYTIIELFFTVLAAVFVKEIILYFYFTINMDVMLSFDTYLSSHLLYTILMNTIIIIIGVFFKKLSIDQEIYKQQINRRRASMSNKY